MPKALRTVVDRDLPPLQVAERRLADLARQRRNRLVAAAALALLAVAVGLAYPQIGIALAVGAIAALVAAAAAVIERRALLANLIPVREAYRIESVSRAGRRFANPGPEAAPGASRCAPPSVMPRTGRRTPRTPWRRSRSACWSAANGCWRSATRSTATRPTCIPPAS